MIPRKNRQNQSVREFILDNVGQYPEKITSMTTEKFDLSRTSVVKYIHRLIEEGLIEAEGKTKARSYKLKKIVNISFGIELSDGMPEDIVWMYRILPFIKDEQKNIIDICQYGFTEILNNAIDHSVSMKKHIMKLKYLF
jgi:DNA-binding transcriptional MocR family regulator